MKKLQKINMLIQIRDLIKYNRIAGDSLSLIIRQRQKPLYNSDGEMIGVSISPSKIKRLYPEKEDK